ncbi:MAG: ATP synthase subunit I [Lachnospiraceae bacterium]|nr:ATP synthase subunit I [Lachnospiraceae bacterium]
MTDQPVMTTPTAGQETETGNEGTTQTTDDGTMYIDPVEDAQNAAETVRDMAVGLAFLGLVFAAVGCIFSGKDWYRWVLGVLLGTVAAGLMLRHLYAAVDRALDMDEEHATKYMKKSATLRILMAGAALSLGAFFPGVFHVFGVFMGVLCLKFAAYLQPLTHKVLKFLSKGR